MGAEIFHQKGNQGDMPRKPHLDEPWVFTTFYLKIFDGTLKIPNTLHKTTYILSA